MPTVDTVLSDYNKFIEMEGLNFSYEKEGEL